MFLKRAILVNWGNIPHLEFEFGPVNLFSGGNGSGKTTAADAIQALMTAAHENLFAFNPGQDETTQKGRGGKQVRTLASYLMGCDDGSFARLADSDGYVAGVFAPTQGEDCEPFTAVMAMRGHIETAAKVRQARLDDLFFIVLPGEQLALTHFVRQDKGGKYLVPITGIVELLKSEFGSGLEVYDKKGAYLRRLYGILRGKKDAVTDREAKHAAHSYAGFMAYKPVKSIHDFVAQEVLEPRDLGEAIRSVSDLMKTIHEMEASAGRVQESIDLLQQVRVDAQTYTDGWLDLQVLRFVEACHSALVNQQTYLSAKRQQGTNQQAIEQAEARARAADEKRQQLHSAMVQLEAQRQGVVALRDQDALRKTRDHNRDKLVSLAQPLLVQAQRLQANLGIAESILQIVSKSSLPLEVPELSDPSFLRQCERVGKNRAAAEFDVHKLFNQDWIDISPLESSLDDLIVWESEHNAWFDYFTARQPSSPSVLDRLQHLLGKGADQRQRLELALRKKQQELQLLDRQQVNYPHYIEAALRAIREACPGSDPKVLCDFVDVHHSDWQMAIEGYLGGARFGIIVEREQEADAIAAVRRIKGERRNSAKVIQGTKAARDAERLSVPRHSIIELMTFNHSTASDYLTASYGNVVQVADVELLKSTARGLTAAGLASGNYSLFRCDLPDAELVFGQGARVRAREAKEQQYQVLCDQLQATQTHLDEVQQVVSLLAQASSLSMVGLVQDMLALQRQIQHSEMAEANLDVSSGQALEQELEGVRNAFEAHEQDRRQLEQSLGAALEQQRQWDQRVKQLAVEQDALTVAQEQAEQVVIEAQGILPRFDADKALSEAQTRAQQDLGKTRVSDEINTLEERLRKVERSLADSLGQHNQTAATADKLVYDTGYASLHSTPFFKQIVHTLSAAEALHNRMKNNILVSRHRQLSQLKDSFNTAFVTNLCHSIYQAINEGQHTLDELNHELEQHRFGSDQERFFFDCAWVPEYQEYWQFFKALINMPDLGDGKTLFDVSLPIKHARTRDRLLAMLLHDDEQTAFRELARISDYRNYRRYEIYKEPQDKQPIALSQYGTGSGGQLETPAYIIRAAAVTSAFRFNEGRSHLRMVMVDEAFSKMDEDRSREVIRYLTESLGLQLIFIMPTSKSGPFLDIISNQFVFTKCPTQTPVGELRTRVLVDRKVCQQEQIARLWAQHRKVIRHQAMLDFMDDLGEQSG